MSELKVWVNRFFDMRNGIAHGFMPVNIDAINEIVQALPTMENLAYTFLSDWEEYGVNPEPE